MENVKVYHSQTIDQNNCHLNVEGPVVYNLLAEWSMHKDLDAFRRPKDQQVALVEIASLPEGRVIVARNGETIIGYVTFHYPDKMERWSQSNMPNLIELGAIEVANEYRSIGLGKKMIQLAFSECQMENVIVFTTEYYWHWDLQNSKLSIWDYRTMMERLMKCVDMVWYATDDPEICSHPANCLMVRIGHNVPISSMEQFDRIRFQYRFMY
jgi:acetoin utilization protein AcuA